MATPTGAILGTGQIAKVMISPTQPPLNPPLAHEPVRDAALATVFLKLPPKVPR